MACLPTYLTLKRRQRVMLVDDDSDVLHTLTRLLVKAGYEVELFNVYDAARARLRDGAPDILITDLRLGGYNGLQLVVYAKHTHPHVAAVVLTGFDDPVLRREADSVGAHYLMKPVRPAELIEYIRAAAAPRPETTH